MKIVLMSDKPDSQSLKEVKFRLDNHEVTIVESITIPVLKTPDLIVIFCSEFNHKIKNLITYFSKKSGVMIVLPPDNFDTKNMHSAFFNGATNVIEMPADVQDLITAILHCLIKVQL